MLSTRRHASHRVVRPCSAVNGAPDDMEKALKGLMAQTKDFKPRVIIDCGVRALAVAA